MTKSSLFAGQTTPDTLPTGRPCSRKRRFEPPRLRWRRLQFKREAVELVGVSGRPVGQIAEELGVSDQTLRNWVHADAGGQGKGSLSPDEKEELKLLRKENKRLRMEREILKEAATFFAQENDPK